MVEIIPAIMPKSLDDFKEKAGFVYRLVKTVHVDVMNGTITHSVNWPFSEIGLTELKKLTTGEIPLPHWKEIDFEVDVMMENPEENFADWVNAGFHRVIVHFENTKKLTEIIHEWKGIVEIGVAVGVDTPNDEVYKYIDEGVDFIQFMGIYQIGFQGNPIDSRVYEKIKKAREVYPNLPISVDGSVNMETAPLLIAAGANRLIIGSAIFNAQEEEHAVLDNYNYGEMVDLSEGNPTGNRAIEKAIKEFKKLTV